MYYEMTRFEKKSRDGEKSRVWLSISRDDGFVVTEHLSISQRAGAGLWVPSALMFDEAAGVDEREARDVILAVRRAYQKAGCPGKNGETMATLEDGELTVNFPCRLRDGGQSKVAQRRKHRAGSTIPAAVPVSAMDDDRLSDLETKLDTVMNALASLVETKKTSKAKAKASA